MLLLGIGGAEGWTKVWFVSPGGLGLGEEAVGSAQGEAWKDVETSGSVAPDDA